MILLIDNYDSFTYNLFQYIGTFTSDIQVVRNDKITIQEIRELKPEKIVLSPGAKSPKEAGICMDVVQHSNPWNLFGTPVHRRSVRWCCLLCKRTVPWKTIRNHP